MSARGTKSSGSLGHSPGQQTLDVLHTRLVSAEEDARSLSRQLADMGFDPKSQIDQLHKGQKSVRFSQRENNPKSGKHKAYNSGSLDTITPFKARIPDSDVLYQNYDALVARVFKMESTIQGLKLHITQAQAERDLSKKDKVAANEKLASVSEVHDKDIQRLNKELMLARTENKEAQFGREEAEASLRKLQQALEESSHAQSAIGFELEDLRTAKTKLQRRSTEIKEELSREKSLRVSLEESHNTLLKRIQDMEQIVEAERTEVQTVSANCHGLKRDSVQAREETNKEIQLRKSLEVQMTSFTRELESRQYKISSLEEDKRLLMDEVKKLDKQYQELIQQLDEMHQVVEKKQSGIAERAEKIQSEENLKQLEDQLRIETRERVQAEKKCCDTEKKMQELQTRMSQQQQTTHTATCDMDREIINLQTKLKTLQQEKDKALRDKDNLLDEVNQAVDSMTEERGHLDQQLQEARIELQTLEQGKKYLQQENARMLERITSIEDQHSTQKHVEHTMTDMMEQKNKLAYEKGRLQSKVEQMQSELESLANAQTDLTQARRTNSALESKMSKLQFQLDASNSTIQKLESQLKHSNTSGNRKEKDFDIAIKARDDAVKEAQKLLKHIEALQDKEKQKKLSFQQSLADLREDNKKMASTLEAIMQSHSQLQLTIEGLQVDLGRKDNRLIQLQEEKLKFEGLSHKLQKEVDQLGDKIMTFEGLESTQVTPLRKALQQCKDDNQKLAKNVESLLKTNSDLQQGVDELQDELHRKSHITDKMQKTRDRDEAQHKQDTQTYEERLENLRQQLTKARDKTLKKSNKEVGEVRKQLENVLSKNGDLSRANTDLRHKLTEQEYGSKDQKDKISSLKSHIDHLQKIRSKQEVAIEGLQGLQDQLIDLEKAKNEYMRKTRDQSKTIQDFMSQISTLQSELQSLAKTQVDTSVVVQAQEDELIKERKTAEALRRKYKETMKREQRLEELRHQTEKQLMEANNESLQISTNLQNAHEWFKSKFDHLQGELSSAKRSQTDLEQEQSEAYQLLREEKFQSDETTEKAKSMIRTSRETVSRLADYAEVAQQQTQEQMYRMRKQLEDEKRKAAILHKKLQEFQESSFRHTEELAKEIDYLKTHSWMLNDT